MNPRNCSMNNRWSKSVTCIPSGYRSLLRTMGASGGFLLLIGSVGCGQSATVSASATTPETEQRPATAAEEGPVERPWAKPPAPIAGTWRVSSVPECLVIGGLVVEIEIKEDKPESAIGTVVSPGEGSRVGFEQGELAMELQANDFGNWRGKVKWRSVLGVERWDPAHFVLEDGVLKGTMVVDPCWKDLRPVE